MHTGNIFDLLLDCIPPPVYPCAYREHSDNDAMLINDAGLSLCIQGTYATRLFPMPASRFIPVHTGNIPLKSTMQASCPVYPCAYREHELGISF